MIIKLFGISLRQIKKDLKEEIHLLDKFLNKKITIDNYELNINERINNLEKILHNKKLVIEEKLESELKRLENEGKNIILVETILKISKDLRKELLWKRLKEYWTEELTALNKNNINEAKKQFEKEEKILKLVRKINSLEFHETHMHLSASLDPSFHWKILSKRWENRKWREILKAKYPKEETSLENIMNSNRNNVQKFIKFSKMIILKEKNSFEAFQKIGNILNAIQAVEKEYSQGQYLEHAMMNLAKHCKSQNIKYVEIRNPAKEKWEYKELAEAAQKIEQKTGIIIRFINFLVMKDKQRAIQNYNELRNPNIKKYFVGIDSLHISKSPLPVANHAGEYANPNDKNFMRQDENKNFSRAKNVTRALEEIEKSLKIKNLKRIGHGSMLSLNIRNFVKKAKKDEIQSTKGEIEEAEKLQERLKEEIQKRKGEKELIIEANPTSNVMIGGFNYRNHPIREFKKRQIKYAISTDDRTIFDTNMKKEFYRIARAMNWCEKDLEEAVKMQNEAIFLTTN